MKQPLVGQGRIVINMISDTDSFIENKIDSQIICGAEYGDCAVVGSSNIDGQICTIIATDGMTANPRYPVVYAGIIGMEEGYKMASTVYMTMELDQNNEKKRPIILVVDTPGNGPGKIEEILGMNKSTGAYQLALAEARYAGHPIVAIVIGRAISGAFLCHGLQADRILSLSSDYGTMIHVMPLTSISRIINKDMAFLEKIAKDNPVFAAGPEFFYDLGGVEKLVDNSENMKAEIIAQLDEIYQLKAENKYDQLGPNGRGELGDQREGRKLRKQVFTIMDKQFELLNL